MKLEVKTITPELAKKYLEKNKINRRLSESDVLTYSKDMLRGQWILTPQGISIDSDGMLLDGQHRLNAVIKANIPIDMYVFENVDNNAFKVFDTGKKRSASDVLYISGIKNANNISAGLKKYIALKNKTNTLKGGMMLTRVSNIDVLDEYNKSPELFQELHSIVYKCYLKLRIISASDIFAYVYYLIKEKKHTKELVQSFFTQLHYNDNVENNTINILRDKLLNSLLSSIKITGKMKHVLIVKTWNAFVDGKEYKRLQYNINDRQMEEL